MKSLPQIVILLFTVLVFIQSPVATRADCIGNNYEQRVSEKQSVLPSVEMIVPSTAEAGQTVILSATATVDSENGGIKSFFWCADAGLFELNPVEPDYSAVKLTVPINPGVVRVLAQVGDGLGYIAKKFSSINIMGGDSLYFSDKENGIVTFVSSMANLNNSGRITINGETIEGSWVGDTVTFNLYGVIEKDLISFWQPVKLNIYDANSQEIYSGCFPFQDVCIGRWYTHPVMKLWKEGSIQGYSNGKSGIFSPYKPALRSELIATTVRTLLKGETLLEPATNPFSDVRKDDWYATFIQYAKDKNFIQGCDEQNNLFCPADFSSRAEAIKIITLAFPHLANKLATCQSKPGETFPDVPADVWYAPYVCAAKAANVISGYPDGNFRPDYLMTRAEMAKALCIAAFGPAEGIDPGPQNRPLLFAITPLTATVSEPITFTLEGFNLPVPMALAIPDCANLTPVSGGTAEKQEFQCTPTLAGLKNATVNAPDGTVLVEFAVEVNDISTPPPPPSCTPSVTAVSPLTAVLNQTQVFTVKGLCLPETTVFSIAECDNLARLDGDEQQQPFRCLPNSTGDKQGVVKDQPEGT
ncbi:MAG: S-layer homology domain-containing protein, partial [Candidatus Parabeggiatoa sp.]|nr:S-layer homology domain-containing protein [Candidatus Parabeggiatoa sp.]